MPRKIILKGIPASPGNVEGKVKIVNFLNEVKGLTKEDILVTSFLTPDLVSIIRKDFPVLGIITDKGGTTCHAAIVARELKIPYIAGAIDATKKLKNNTFISLDSEKGIIYEKA